MSKEYSIIDFGDGRRGYKCAICENVYGGAFARQDVRNCYARCADLICDTSDMYANHQSRRNYGKVLQTGDGYTRPDRYGRWRLGRTNEQRRLIAYFRALYDYRKQERILSVSEYMKSGLFEPSGLYPRWAGKSSPEQRLAYAFHLGSWERVKSAAYALAYDIEVRRRLNDYFRELKQEIDAAVVRELKEIAFSDGEYDNLYPDIDDMSMN